MAMPDIPFDIKVDIFRRVGRDGFTNLKPIIKSGKEGRDAVFTPEVLSEVSLDEFMYWSLAEEGSAYRPFLLKCAAHGNIVAMYVEALRILRQEGESQVAWDYLAAAAPKLEYASFAFGVFLICAGYPEQGMGMLDIMWEQVGTMDEAITCAQFVVTQIQNIGIAREGIYEDTYNYPGTPWCVYVSCTADDVCKACFGFWYSRAVCEMC